MKEAGDGHDQGRNPDRALDQRRKPGQILYTEVFPMDIDSIITIIGSLGFPIAMCIYMTVTFNKTLEKLDDRILSLTVMVETLIKNRADDG